ncbi:COQ9 family protein [Magnetospirillum sp. UT-4]|uniref:COQ9 family protein n=1 Tax=Magnetospirillum sp. UT-4 TaxID=2681467 RepID=UPI00137F0F45|nr:COQ9 family protein [Magnetospirillum sp. UT-4]CAA7613557.1 conserved hypothetical protein [Magnetospirillum sp. UT-4]
MTAAPFQSVRDRLVLAALPHAVFDGWSARSLAAAARDEGLDPTMAERAFLGGPAAAVDHLVDLADRLMAEEAAGLDLDSMRVPDRVFTLLKLRFERWAPHREAIRRAMALLALPGNAAGAARITWRTADVVWRLAGDRSHDFSWYTRRATLAAVCSATLLYWLDDPSEDSADTWAFLRRRLADVGRVTRARKQAQSWLEGLPRRMPRGLRP